MNEDFSGGVQGSTCLADVIDHTLLARNHLVAPRAETSDTRKIVISANGIATAAAVRKWMRNSGGASISSIAPRIIATVPPIPSTPCEVNLASRTNSATDNTSSAAPTQLIGSTDKRRKPEQRQNPAGHAREDGPGAAEFNIQAERAEGEQDEPDVWIGDCRHEPLAPGLLVPGDLCTGGGQHLFAPVEPRDLAAVQRLEKRAIAR